VNRVEQEAVDSPVHNLNRQSVNSQSIVPSNAPPLISIIKEAENKNEKKSDTVYLCTKDYTKISYRKQINNPHYK